MNNTDLAYATIEEIGKLFRKRKLSPSNSPNSCSLASSRSIPN